MFNDKPSRDTNNTGKRVSYTKKPDSFSIGWDVQQTNQDRKKAKEVQIKINSQASKSNQPFQQPQKQNREQQYIPKQAPLEKKPQKLQINQEQVFQSLRKYQKLEDMPQDELDKVLYYYQNMKNQEDKPKQYEQQSYGSKNYSQQGYPNQQQFKYQPANQYAPSSSNSIPIETRQPIRPKDSIKGVINNEPNSQANFNNTRCSQKNKSTLSLGDGYNPFAQQPQKSIKKTEFQRIQDNAKKPSANKEYKISNIFG